MATSFKLGDKVKILSHSRYPCTGGDDFCNDNADKAIGRVGVVKEILTSCYQVNDPYLGFYDADELELVSKTLDDLEVGDILIDKFNAEKKVLGICGEVIFLSANNFETYGGGFTLKEIKNVGYKLKKESETVELTMDEIASRLGIPIEKLKIKKEK